MPSLIQPSSKQLLPWDLSRFWLILEIFRCVKSVFISWTPNQISGAGLEERELVGGGCSDKVSLTSWTGQASNIGRGSLEDVAGYQVFGLKADPGDTCSWQVAGWLQGEVEARGEVRAALEATYTR